MLILEVLLSFFAWRRGWKWMALLPLGIAFGIGLALGASGNFDGNDLGGLIWIDVIAAIVLILMIIFEKKEKEIKE